MRPLTQAIDETVAYVRKHPDLMNRGQVNQLQDLADRVYELAAQAGLLRTLPQIHELEHELQYPGLCQSPPHFETKLNVPGDWTIIMPRDGGGLPLPSSLDASLDPPLPVRVFLPCASDRWFRDMAVLRKLAEAGDVPKGEGDDQLPGVGTRFSTENVPAAFREGGDPQGPVLTAPYLAKSPNWFLNGPYLTKHSGPGKELTTYIKVGRAKAYLYVELLVVRDRKTANDDRRAERP